MKRIDVKKMTKAVKEEGFAGGIAVLIGNLVQAQNDVIDWINEQEQAGGGE